MKSRTHKTKNNQKIIYSNLDTQTLYTNIQNLFLDKLSILNWNLFISESSIRYLKSCNKQPSVHLYSDDLFYSSSTYLSKKINESLQSNNDIYNYPGSCIYLKDAFPYLNGLDFIDIYLSIIKKYSKSHILIRYSDKVSRRYINNPILSNIKTLEKTVFHNLNIQFPIENITFKYCIFTNISFYSKLKNVTFDNCILLHCDFLSCDPNDYLDEVTIKNSHLQYTTITYAKLLNCTIEDNTYIESISIRALLILSSYLKNCKIYNNLELRFDIIENIILNSYIDNNCFNTDSYFEKNYLQDSLIHNSIQQSLVKTSGNYLLNCDVQGPTLQYLLFEISNLYPDPCKLSYSNPVHLEFYENKESKFKNNNISLYTLDNLYNRIKKYLITVDLPLDKSHIYNMQLPDLKTFHSNHINTIMNQYFFHEKLL